MMNSIDRNDGIQSNTFHIYDQKSLEEFRDRVNDGELSLNALVTADFSINITNWIPIADYGTDPRLQYRGIFNGCGHTISGLIVDHCDNSHMGLFGYILGGVVTDLILSRVSLSVYDTGGGIVAYLDNGSIKNCEVKGLLTGCAFKSFEDGLKYYNNDSFYNTVTIGGIAGVSHNSEIIGCCSYGEINGQCDFAGGIIGNCGEGCCIEKNINLADIDMIGKKSSDIGGIVGTGTSSNITHNVNLGALFQYSSSLEKSCVGGIVGTAIDRMVIAHNLNLGNISCGFKHHADDIVGFVENERLMVIERNITRELASGIVTYDSER